MTYTDFFQAFLHCGQCYRSLHSKRDQGIDGIFHSTLLGEDVVRVGDILILSGDLEDVEKLDQRRAGHQGDKEHTKSVEEQDEFEERAKLDGLQSKLDTKLELEVLILRISILARRARFDVASSSPSLSDSSNHTDKQSGPRLAPEVHSEPQALAVGPRTGYKNNKPRHGRDACRHSVVNRATSRFTSE